jgi:hypothetical protein
MPKGKPVTYEVVWAEDGDLPTIDAPAGSAAPGAWVAGGAVVGGTRALRLEGTHARPITGATGETPVRLRQALIAFAHVRRDPTAPPRAVGLGFIAEGRSRRLIWGEAAAFAGAGEDLIVAGPLPDGAGYVRLEADAAACGLRSGAAISGVQLLQSDGVAWWDHVGARCTSPDAGGDPLLSKDAWIDGLRNHDAALRAAHLPRDIKYLINLNHTQYIAGEARRLADFHRDHIYAPLRGALEPQAHAVRRLLAEQVGYELRLPGTPIAREAATPRVVHDLLRGRYDQPGEVVQPGTPAFLPPLAVSGRRATRLDLARWLVDARQPLTARVAVNRWWQGLFGAGLVQTPGDFGAQGEPPTHPELLDWLAHDFADHGWDVKRLLRLLVTSRTYRQDGRCDAALLARDPDNRLLARGARVRLDAEVLRDQALHLGGLLDLASGGPPVRPPQPAGVWEAVAYVESNTRSYRADAGAAAHRRSLYTFWKRTAPPPAMTVFDAPSRETACLRRERTNTPLQALALLNDPQQVEAARAFAARLLRLPGDDAARLAHGFRAATARAPDPGETAVLLQALAAQRRHFADPATARRLLAVGGADADPDLPAEERAAWAMIASLVLNLDEVVCR